MLYFKKIIPLCFLYLFVRVISFVFPPESIINTGISSILFLGTIYLLIKKDERGWYIVAAELFLGGSGNFLSLSSISLRTCLAIASLIIFFITHIKQIPEIVKNNKYVVVLLSVLYFIVLSAAVRGYIFHHSLQFIIADTIPYLFFLYYFPLKELFSSPTFKSFAKTLLAATLVSNICFTLVTFFGYAFNVFTLQDSYYHWFRDVANGKITDLGSHFFRIVLNEHLLLIPLLILLLHQLIHNKKVQLYSRKILVTLYISCLAILAVNITRIYILALGFGLIALFSKTKIKQWLLYSAATIGIFFTLFTFFHLIASRGQSFGWELFGLRIQSIAKPTTEESALSRMLLLKPISVEIKKHPLLGSGLGDTITVYSPVEKHIITTNQFDWGYLELLPDWLATAARLNPVTYTVLLVREMMTGVTEGVSTILSIGVIAIFVAVMVGLASYVFTREVNKPF
jgi:hypothetical protein